MDSIECLPDEIISKCLSYVIDDCIETRIINKKFCKIRNELFRQRVLEVFPLDCEIWQYLLSPLREYIRVLDSVRQESRLILSDQVNRISNTNNNNIFTLDSLEYINDSWELIYNILRTPSSLYNFQNDVNTYLIKEGDDNEEERDNSSEHGSIPDNIIVHRRDRHFQILMNSNVAIPVKEPYVEEEFSIPLNIWIHIEDTSYAKYFTRIITEVTSLETSSTEVYFFVSYLHEWIKEPGIYCIKLGTISKKFLTIRKEQGDDGSNKSSCKYYAPLNIKTYIGNETEWWFGNKLKFLGYDFNKLANFTHKWIFYQIPIDENNCIFNKFESIINQIISNYQIHNYLEVSNLLVLFEKICKKICNNCNDSSTSYHSAGNIHLKFLYTFPIRNNIPPKNPVLKSPKLPKLLTKQ